MYVQKIFLVISILYAWIRDINANTQKAIRFNLHETQHEENAFCEMGNDTGMTFYLLLASNTSRYISLCMSVTLDNKSL